VDAERRDFFVSFTSADEAWAEWIAWQLEVEGFTVVSMAWDFRPSQNFVLNMQRALEASDRVLAVLSPSYLSALYTQPEWAAAIAEDPTGAKGKLLAVRVRACEPKGLWHAIARIELEGLDEATARQALLAGVKLDRAKPAGPPAFPAGAPRAAAVEPRFPGILPPIWNVPHQRNPHFTGREELLTELEEALASVPAVITQAITGLGGVGKTQLATEYCYRHAADYDLVWWIRSAETAALAADYAKLAGPLGLGIEDEQDQRLIVEGVRRALEQRGGWLLVFDNAEDRQQVRDFLPHGGGHAIVTSRDPVWGGVARPLAVRTWPREDSVQFLLKRTDDEDEAAASELAEALGDFPLALEHAAAYAERTGCSLARYLKLFRESHQALWARATPPDEYHATIATTWELAFQRLREESPAATDLLSLCAFLAPDDIPRAIIVEGADLLPERLAEEVRDPVAFDDLIAALRRYSLIEASDDALSVHRLVQTVTQDALEPEARKEWAGCAAAVVNRAFPQKSADVRTWDDCSRLLPHALAAAGAAEELGVAPKAADRLLNQVGLYLTGRADLAGAKRALQRAVAVAEAAYGPEHPEVATDVSNLGDVLHEMGDLDGARMCFERALGIDEAALGPEHPAVGIDVGNLGKVLRDLGELSMARQCHERAIAIHVAAYGEGHPTVAVGLSDLAGVLCAEGDLAGARAHLERALAIDEAAFGTDHPKVAIRVNNLGGVLHAAGDVEGARACCERALPIFEKVLGADHANVATLVNNLGMVLRALGDLKGARACFERSLAIDEAAFGPQHPAVATDVNNLGLVGDLAGARECFEQARAIDEAAYGAEHPNVARDVSNLGSVLEALGDLVGARACFERALRIWRQFLGDEHPKAKIARENLERVERAMREAEEE